MIPLASRLLRWRFARIFSGSGIAVTGQSAVPDVTGSPSRGSMPPGTPSDDYVSHCSTGAWAGLTVGVSDTKRDQGL
ncbi:hypothetical protein BMS3Abin02_01272 [bacterium BMS3Abin02]|nr:hypothetical protein BMS3Abin02_01272 [bacterium BMS3Abin02]GBE22500.1 hypothetical protein BMS3Bbin01_01875 [bacterium BMS3Bbin01]